MRESSLAIDSGVRGELIDPITNAGGLVKFSFLFDVTHDSETPTMLHWISHI
ncbi:MAG: hypothetical protein OXF06_07470 [Bacteroidetes bacterium]|nr:hypothetical protein [Bacteroidota bacterium]